MPTAEAKAAAWAEGVEDVSTPNSVIEALAAGFQRVAEPSLLAPYVAQFHETIAGVWAARTHAAAEAINSFYPLALSGPELLAASNAWLENNPGAPAALRRVIAENRDGVERAVKAQAGTRWQAETAMSYRVFVELASGRPDVAPSLNVTHMMGWFVGVPARVVVTIIGALVARWLLHRAMRSASAADRSVCRC